MSHAVGRLGSDEEAVCSKHFTLRSTVGSMVGKIKHVRQKIHHEAVKLTRPSGASQPPDSGLPLSLEKPLVFGRHITSPSPAVEHGNSDASKYAKKVRENCPATLHMCGQI